LYDIDDQITGAVAVVNDITEIITIEQELEATIRRLTLLRRIEVELSESLDINSVLTITMDTAQRATGAENGFIGLLEGDQLRVVHAVGVFVKDMTRNFDSGIIGRTLRTLQPQLVLDVDADPDYVRDIPGMKAQMTIPLIHRDHLIGALSLETAKPVLFTSDAFDFLTLIAGHITVSLDNAQLYQVSQQQLDELHQLYMRVSELEQLKTDMIRIAAHDLRNPLSLISGYVELLREDSALNEEQELFVQSIDKAQRKMFKIIDDILSLQRVEAAQDNKSCEEIDLSVLVRDLFNGNDVRARQKTQTYELSLPEQPLSVCVDVAQVREAIDNLIGNAIKYTPAGGSVMVRLAMNGKHAVFDVEDTGLGIPEDQQGRIFQPFFRASNARLSQIEGTGLGLHLVKNIIERHGGRMRFTSVQGQGSHFGFELPVG
jgi:signal transduction histidine kinase